MVGCVVPGCTNRTVRMAARVPEDSQLRASWRAAIFGGTGQQLSDFTINGKHVCNMHFPPHQQPSRGSMYCEPTLYLVDYTWTEVSCCQLCLQYKPVERMFNRKYCLEQTLTLQSLAYKYFRVRQFIKSSTQESYFCEACVVQIDITHRFCEQINENSRAYERMLRKTSKTVVIFDQCAPKPELTAVEPPPALDEMEDGGLFSSEQVVIKEEPRDEQETSVVNADVGILKAETAAAKGHSDCEVEENEFETIEVDDEDDEPEVKIKIEPDLEETPVKIKQEVLDQEDVPALELTLSVNVKKEPSEEVELLPAAKKQRINFKYGCLMCKAFFQSQFELNLHLQEVAHEKVLNNCVSCRAPIVSQTGQVAKCDRCEGITSTKSPRILNKQFTPNKTVPGTHTCGPCKRQFLTESSLAHHQKQDNCKSTVNTCTQCNETFQSEGDLGAHVELAHNAPRRGKKCLVCGEAVPGILFDLHQLLLCGENLPEHPEETHLKQCALLFFRQKHHPKKAYWMLRNKFGEHTGVTQDMVATWYAQFVEGDCACSDSVQTRIKELINENVTISVQELSEQVGVHFDSVRLRTGLMGLMLKYGRWVPQELPTSMLKSRFNFCRALLARYKNGSSLSSMIMCSERWVYYGNGSHQHGEDTKVLSELKKVLLCVWWDQRGLIFHELLEPQQAAVPDRYQTQFSRFTKAMQSARQKIPNQVIFQYGITEPTARQQLKAILSGIGWELLRHPVHSPDIDPTDYHLFQSMQYGLKNLYFASPGQVYEWVAKMCKEQTATFYLRGIRTLFNRWQKVVENKGDYCGQ